MRKFFAIWARELGACFYSPVAYVLLIVFTGVASAMFLAEVTGRPVLDGPPTTPLFEGIVTWFTILVTVVSMRLFAEEKRSGTLETLMTAPVSETQVVLGKYAGALSFLLLAGLPVLASYFLFIGLSPGLSGADIDWGSLAAGSVTLVLVYALCTAVGLFASLLTRNQVVAAICCFGAVWGVLLGGWILAAVPGCARAGEYLMVTDYLHDAARGVLDTRPVVLFTTGTAFLLFASVRVLESRRWK